MSSFANFLVTLYIFVMKLIFFLSISAQSTKTQSFRTASTGSGSRWGPCQSEPWQLSRASWRPCTRWTLRSFWGSTSPRCTCWSRPAWWWTDTRSSTPSWLRSWRGPWPWHPVTTIPRTSKPCERSWWVSPWVLRKAVHWVTVSSMRGHWIEYSPASRVGRIRSQLRKNVSWLSCSLERP